MIEREKAEGGFFCQPDHFRLLCRLEERRYKRENRPLFLGLLTLTRPGNGLPPASVPTKTTADLKQVIAGSIRVGDIYTQWNEAQFLLLLPGQHREMGKQVLQRIQTRFKEKVEPTGLVLKYTIQPLLG